MDAATFHKIKLPRTGRNKANCGGRRTDSSSSTCCRTSRGTEIAQRNKPAVPGGCDCRRGSATRNQCTKYLLHHCPLSTLWAVSYPGSQKNRNPLISCTK